MKFITSYAAKLMSVLLLLIITTAFQYNTEDTHSTTPKRLVTLNSEEFSHFSNNFYRQLKFTTDTLDPEVLRTALKGYMYLKATDQLPNKRYLTIIDFTQFCNQKRMWVLDLEEKTVKYNEMVAHGRRSGDEYAMYFSNQHRSNKSSLGFYLTGGTYYGRNGLSLKLNGIEKQFNSNAYARGIVIHGANYVGDNYIRYNKRIGRSFGCPAVSQSINKELVNTLKDGTCLFIYHNWKYYNENSHLVNADLYIPMEDLTL